MRLLAALGVVVAALGAAALLAPRPTVAAALRVAGLRLPADPARHRAAAWLLILVGLAVTVVARLVG